MSKRNRSLGNNEILFYNTNGYLVLDNFFSESECDWMLAIFKKHTDRDFRALMNIERKEPEILEKVIKNPRLISVIEDLHNAEMCCLGSQVLFKEAGSKYARHAWNPHQDASYLETPYGTHISAIIALEKSGPNGGMYIYPYSHREPLLPYEPHASFDPDSNPGHEIKEIPPYYKPLDLVLNKGSLYIQHGNLIHGSYPNLSACSRPHFGIVYIVREITFNPGKNNDRKITLLH